jgi:hypothetical protein
MKTLQQVSEYSKNTLYTDNIQDLSLMTLESKLSKLDYAYENDKDT